MESDRGASSPRSRDSIVKAMVRALERLEVLMKPKARLVAAVVLACTVLGVSAQVMSLPRDVIDRYDVLARNLLAGHGLTFDPALGPTVARGPAYPAWLALEMFATGGELGWVRVAESGLLIAVGALAWRIVVRSGAGSTAVLGFLLVVVHPIAVVYTLKLGSETFCAALVAALGVLWPARGERTTAGRLLVTALLLVALLLSKSVFVFVPILWAMSAVVAWGARLAWKPAVLVLGLCSACLTPWLWRNANVSGGYWSIQTLAGWNFWYDFDADEAWAAGQLGEGGATPRVFYRLPVRYQGHPYGLTATEDVEQESRLVAAAVGWVKDHPKEFVRKCARNLWQFWCLTSSRNASLILGLIRVIELMGVLIGAWALLRRQQLPLMIWALGMIVILPLVMSPVLGVARYSVVVSAPIAVVICIGIDEWSRVSRQQLVSATTG